MMRLVKEGLMGILGIIKSKDVSCSALLCLKLGFRNIYGSPNSTRFRFCYKPGKAQVNIIFTKTVVRLVVPMLCGKQCK